MTSTLSVSFVIPVRNDAKRLGVCLKSIRSNDFPNEHLEIIVVDNGFTDDSASVAEALGAIVLSMPGARLGAMRNAAAHRAQGQVLAFVDADHAISPDWIRAATEALEQTGAGAVGAACHPPNPGTWVQRAYDALRRHAPAREPVDWLGSGNMAVRRDLFVKVGGFDTSLETCEDVDLCRRFLGAGAVIEAEPRMYNTHFGDPETLRHVFLGELWRGRDNLKVSLRPPLRFRTLVSAGIPVIGLVALLVTIAGVVLGGSTGKILIVLGLAAVAGLLALRTIRMTSGRPWSQTLSLAAVAAAYDFGRMFSLVARMGNGGRRRNS